MNKQTDMLKENDGGGRTMKFYTIKLPRFIGSIVKVFLGMFKKD